MNSDRKIKLYELGRYGKCKAAESNRIPGLHWEHRHGCFYFLSYNLDMIKGWIKDQNNPPYYDYIQKIKSLPKEQINKMISVATDLIEYEKIYQISLCKNPRISTKAAAIILKLLPPGSSIKFLHKNPNTSIRMDQCRWEGLWADKEGNEHSINGYDTLTDICKAGKVSWVTNQLYGEITI